MMRIALLLVSVLVFAIGGCRATPTDPEPDVEESSVTEEAPRLPPRIRKFGSRRWNEYAVEREATESLRRLENMLRDVLDIEEDGDIPDDVLMQLFNEVDLDNSHTITLSEVDLFLGQAVDDYEESLPQLVIRARKK